MEIPRYITQLTKEWIRDVSKRLIAGNCINLKESGDSREVAVDIDALKLQLDTGDGTGTVKSVDGVEPDSSGNVTINAVTEDDLDGYATQNWVTSELASYATDSELDTVSQSVSDLTDVVQTINDDYVTSDDLAQYAKTSDIASTYETKADATAISDRVDTIEGEYVTEDDLGDYVTTDTNQTITGLKTIDGNERIVLNEGAGGFARVKFTNGATPIGYIGVYDHINPCSDMLGTCIFGGGTGGADQCLIVGSTTSGPEVRLWKTPTSHDETNSLSVPTMGWTNNLFLRKATASSTYATKSALNSYLTTSAASSTYATKSALNSYLTTSAASSTYATITTVEDLTDVVQMINDDYVTSDDLDTTIDNKISTYSTTADAKYATLDEFNDLYDLVEAIDEDLSAVEDWKGTGVASISTTVVTNVTWTGSALTMTKRSLTFTDGLLTDAGTESTSTIDTAVLFDQS